MSRVWHLPSQVGNAYESSFFGTRGVHKNCVFLPLCYCSDTLLDVRKPTKLGFQLLDENPLLWWLFFPWFLYLARLLYECHRGCTLALRYTAPSLLYFTSLPWVKQEICVYQDLTKSLILTFFIFPVLWKKLLSCMFSWLKTKDFLPDANCLFGRTFCLRDHM